MGNGQRLTFKRLGAVPVINDICHSHTGVVSITHEEDICRKNTDQKERLDRASIVSFFKPRNLQRPPW